MADSCPYWLVVWIVYSVGLDTGFIENLAILSVDIMTY